MKVLLTGGSGQLGRALFPALAGFGGVVAPSHAGFDLGHAATLEARLDALRPGLIVNAAAYTAVDAAEADRAAAFAVNAESVGVIARWAARHDVPLAHFSTDYVFDGRLDRPCREDDATAPLNVYGASKRAGEEAVEAAGGRALVLRTGWLYGPSGDNFLTTMLRLMASRPTLSVVVDQIGAPTPTGWLAEATRVALRRCLAADAGWGLYHVTAAGATSWHGFAQAIAREAAARGVALACAPDAIRPIAAAEWGAAASRPANSRLDCSLFTSTFDFVLPDWRQGLAEVLDLMTKHAHDAT